MRSRSAKEATVSAVAVELCSATVAKKPEKKERDVYVYFDNSMEGHAFFDAVYLAEKLKVKSPAK